MSKSDESLCVPDEKIYQRSLLWSSLMEKIESNCKEETEENSMIVNFLEDYLPENEQEEKDEDDSEAEEVDDIESSESEDDHDIKTTLNNSIVSHDMQLREWKEDGMDKVLDSFCSEKISRVVGPWLANRSLNRTLGFVDVKPEKRSKIKASSRAFSKIQKCSPIAEENSQSSYDSVDEISYIKTVPKQTPKRSSDLIVREYVIKNRGKFYEFVNDNNEEVDPTVILDVVSNLSRAKDKSRNSCSFISTSSFNTPKKSIPKRTFQSENVCRSRHHFDTKLSESYHQKFNPGKLFNSTGIPKENQRVSKRSQSDSFLQANQSTIKSRHSFSSSKIDKPPCLDPVVGAESLIGGRRVLNLYLPHLKHEYTDHIKQGEIEFNETLLKQSMGTTYFDKFINRFDTKRRPYKISCKVDSRLVYYIPILESEEDSSSDEDDCITYDEKFGFIKEVKF